MDLGDMMKKAQDALPDDATIEKAADAIRDKAPDGVDALVDKAEAWAKDNNKS